jgi:anti-sigma B factor antagonist
MNLETNPRGRYLVVTILENRLGADRALSFKESIIRLIDNGHRAFVVDFSQVTFIDSSGLGAILSIAKRLGTTGDILIAGTSETVGNMFKLTRMNRIFPMFATLEEALSAPVHVHD